jgi:hypothetical protein
MSELIDNRARRTATQKENMQHLHNGQAPDAVKVQLPQEMVRQSNPSKSKLALNPKHPERICWGCDKYCSADDLRCGNGTIRTQHPVELFGEDWMQWELNHGRHETADVAQSAGAPASPGNDIG